MTLREITSIIAERAGRAFDTPFHLELEKMIHYWRAEMIQQALNKRPSDRKFFTQSFEVDVEDAKTECEDLECDVSRTVSLIPSPVRANGILFDYVGAADRTNSFKYMTSAAIETDPYNRYTKDMGKYMYRNDRIYIIKSPNTETIVVEGIFEDPTALAAFKCGGSVCYSDTSAYPMPLDITKRVVNAILTNELRLPGEIEKEINVKAQ